MRLFGYILVVGILTLPSCLRQELGPDSYLLFFEENTNKYCSTYKDSELEINSTIRTKEYMCLNSLKQSNPEFSNSEIESNLKITEDVLYVICQIKTPKNDSTLNLFNSHLYSEDLKEHFSLVSSNNIYNAKYANIEAIGINGFKTIILGIENNCLESNGEIKLLIKNITPNRPLIELPFKNVNLKYLPKLSF